MTSAHIAIVLYGSRGDIQPGICLALELQVRGHRVSALVPPNLAGLARATGVRDVHEIGLDSDTAWSSEDARSARNSRNPWARVAFALRTVRGGFDALDAALERLFIAGTALLRDTDGLSLKDGLAHEVYRSEGVGRDMADRIAAFAARKTA